MKKKAMMPWEYVRTSHSYTWPLDSWVLCDACTVKFRDENVDEPYELSDAYFGHDEATGKDYAYGIPECGHIEDMNAKGVPGPRLEAQYDSGDGEHCLVCTDATHGQGNLFRFWMMAS